VVCVLLADKFSTLQGKKLPYAVASVLSDEVPSAPPTKKGRTKSIHGYIILSGQYSHPKATGGSFNVPEHIIVMEKHLGRHLKPNETVHHKNGIRDDNRIDNLELWTSSHPYGQRVEDLLKFVIDNYPDELRKLL